MATTGMDPGSSPADPWDCVDHFLGAFRDAPYFRPGTQWKDYEPAYRLGCETFERYRGHGIADLDGELEREWRDAKWSSRLTWSEARAAIDDAWTWLARRSTQDADNRWRCLYVQLIGLLAQRLRRRATHEIDIDEAANDDLRGVRQFRGSH